jgi:hypothetical protein
MGQLGKRPCVMEQNEYSLSNCRKPSGGEEGVGTSQLVAVVNQTGYPDPRAGQFDPSLGDENPERGVTRRGPPRS